MVFSSPVFLCVFLPVVLILHSVCKNRIFQNGLLLIASLLFYAYGEPVYVLLMIASALFNYLFALLLHAKHSKPLLAIAVLFNVGLLGVFKYAGFLMRGVNELTGLSLPVPNIALPIGISFFTFQALSYVIDVYRDDVGVQKNFAKVLLYISFFPQLIAGPIVRYRDIAEEIDERTVTLTKVSFGMRRFIAGLGKKVLIANAMGAVADYMFNSELGRLNSLAAWIGAIAYLMQIYYDFSGYSDMAIGLGKMFGFRFAENFDTPYLAQNIKDFWRRWHISLSSWFRDYVYIPLGGNRKGKARAVLNRIFVFFLTGLWHGANWTFVVWGLFHGFFLLLEEAIPKLRKLPHLFGRIYALLVITVGFVIFRADTLGGAVLYLKQMFTGFQFTSETMSVLMRPLTPYFILMLIAAVVGCSRLPLLLKKALPAEGKETLTKREGLLQTVSFILAGVFLVWCIIRLAGSSYNPFIYFRF